MAFIQLPDRETFGSGFGRGLSTGIGNLIDMKLKDMEKQQQVKTTQEGLSQYLGKEKAEAIAPLAVENPQLAMSLIDADMRGVQQDTIGGALSQLGYNKEESEVLGGLPRNILNSLIRKGVVPGKKQKDLLGPPPLKSRMSHLKKIRKALLKKNILAEDAISDLKNKGFSDSDIKIATSVEITDDIIRYFLDKTNNDPKKAMKIAKSFGYKV